MKTYLSSILNPLDWEMPSIDTEPTDEEPSGGGDNDSDDFLGEGGIKALRTEREQRKALEREMAQMRQQLAAVKDLNPEAYRQAQDKAAELERRLQEREQLTEAERKRIETKAQQQIAKATTEAQQEKERRVALEIKTAVRSYYSAAEGKDGADSSGLSFFDAYMDFHGKKHFRLDETTGKVFVVDAEGDRIDADPIEWLNEQADNSQVIGAFFKPKGGVGSGGLIGARGVRETQGRSVDELSKMSPGKLLEAHYGS